MDLLKALRWREWYASKIPFVWTACAAAALTSPLSSAEILRRGASVIAFSCLCAAFGHWANDLGDRACDEAAGRRTRAGRMSTAPAMLVLLLLGVASLAALAPLAPSRLAVAGGIAELLLAAAYSLPPLRLKARRSAGIWSAAAAQRTLPMLVALTAIGNMNAAAWLLLAVAQLAGTRWILVHQLADVQNDRRAGVPTWVSVAGEERAWSLMLMLLPLELAMLALCLSLQATTSRGLWMVPVIGIMTSAMWVWQCRGVQAPYSLEGYARQPLSGFYQLVWPLGLLLELALVRRQLWAVPLAFIAWQHRYVAHRVTEFLRLSRSGAMPQPRTLS